MSAPTHKPAATTRYRKQLLTGFVIAIAIYLGFFLLLENSGQLTGEVIERLRAFPLPMIGLVIVCQLMVILFRFIEWQYYLGVIDARDKISIFDSFLIFTVGFTLVVSPAKVAEVLKSVLLKTKTGVPVARSAPVVIAERVVDGIAVIVLMMLILFFAGDQLALGEFRNISEAIIFSSGGVLLAGLIVVQIAPLAYFFLNLVGRIPLVNRLHAPLVEFYESSREIFRLRHVIPMTLVGVGVYGSSAAGFVVILIGLGVPFSIQLCLQATFITGVAAAVGALSFVPNGAGVTEFSNTAMLDVIVLPATGAALAIAPTAALMQGFFHKWFRVIVGMLMGFIFRNRLFTEQFEQAVSELEQEKVSHR